MTHKITSINQTGGIIAEEVNVSSDLKFAYDMTSTKGQYGKEGEPMKLETTRTQAMLNTLREEGYKVFSTKEWEDLKNGYLQRMSLDICGLKKEIDNNTMDTLSINDAEQYNEGCEDCLSLLFKNEVLP